MCLRQSGAVRRGAVGQPSRSSMAQAIMSLPPTNLITSLHLKRVQFKILVWKAANQIFSNSPGKPNPSVFSGLTCCPCRQCTTLCRSVWVVCVGSKAAVGIWCPHILRMYVALTYRTIPSHISIWMERSPCREYNCASFDTKYGLVTIISRCNHQTTRLIGKDGNNVALQDSVPCFYRYVLVFDYFLHLLESILCHAYSYFNFGIASSI